LVTPESKADGLGGVRADRFGKSVATVAEAFQLPNVKPEDVFDPAYLPDAAIRKLP
jgi:NitT/TauT family transport system substrate-binding protein